MDRGGLLPFQLWCPRPFGTYSQNQPRPPSAALKPSACPEPGGGAEPDHGPAHSENTPPALATEAPASQPAPLLSAAAAGDEGRVLLDTWYVIKPGNTKEKVAFFVAHQCGGGSRASSMKVKGHWGSDSSKAKRRRRCLEPTKAPPDPGGQDGPPAAEGAPASASEDVDLLSVAEMVALVRIAFRISNSREPRAPDGSLPNGSGGRPGCAYPGSPGPGARAKDKITCDLYQLISPSRDALPSNVEFLLARADEASEGETPAPARPEDTPPAPPPPPARDCGASGFHIQRLLEPRQYMLLLPEHVLVKIFSFLPTRALAALKCTCHHFKGIIEAFGREGQIIWTLLLKTRTLLGQAGRSQGQSLSKVKNLIGGGIPPNYKL
ncbi:hypothetical protein E2I00_009912, partial [Balaenoptera physalus]